MSLPFPTPEDCQSSDSLWFEDGNVVIMAGYSLFRVFRGLLASRSSVFKEIFSTPRPPTPDDMYDGCLLVRLPDEAAEVHHFLMAIFTSS